MAVDNLRYQNYSCHLRKKISNSFIGTKACCYPQTKLWTSNFNIVNLMKVRNLPDTLTSFVVILCAHCADVTSRTVLHFATRIGTIPIFAYLDKVRNLRHCYWRSCIRFVNPQSLRSHVPACSDLEFSKFNFSNLPLQIFFFFEISLWIFELDMDMSDCFEKKILSV